MPQLRTLTRLARPFSLVLATLTFSFGSGVAHYLGHDLLPEDLLALVWIFLLQTASAWLVEYFRNPAEPLADVETPRQREQLRILLLQASSAALTLLAAITILMLAIKALNPAALLVMGLAFTLMLVNAIPPVRLISRGFGELAQAVFLAYLIPALAFLQQTDRLHSLITLLAFPLALLALTYLLALDFPSYAADLKYQRGSLLVRLGWERTMPLHHGLVLAAYALLALGPLLGYPLALLWPTFLTFPLALYQIFMLRNISVGAKPVWSLLTANGAAVFALSAYLLTLTFWLR
jgi:1,4-dihydroxy-2-naphthoate octaprenyltransferase